MFYFPDSVDFHVSSIFRTDKRGESREGDGDGTSVGTFFFIQGIWRFIRQSQCRERECCSSSSSESTDIGSRVREAVLYSAEQESGRSLQVCLIPCCLPRSDVVVVVERRLFTTNKKYNLTYFSLPLIDSTLKIPR